MWPIGRAWDILPSKGWRVTIKMYCGDLMELKTTIIIEKLVIIFGEYISTTRGVQGDVSSRHFVILNGSKTLMLFMLMKNTSCYPTPHLMNHDIFYQLHFLWK